VHFAASPPDVHCYTLGRTDITFIQLGVGMTTGPVFVQDQSQLLWIAPQRHSVGEVAVVDVLTQNTLQLLRRGTNSAISSVQFSADGRCVAICGYRRATTTSGLTAYVDGVVHLWDVESGRLLLEHKWDDGHYRTVALSSDGRILAVGGGELNGDTLSGRVVVFDLSTKESIATLTDHHEPVDCVLITPDNKQLLSAGMDCELKTWSISENGTSLANSTILGSGPMRVIHLAIAPNGTLIFAALANFNRGQKAGELRVIESASHDTLTALLKDHTVPIAMSAVSPDGHTLIASDADGTLYSWDIESRENRHIAE
jgi:WD40 repeat protein